MYPAHHHHKRRGRRRERDLEYYAFVLDYLPMGNPLDRHPYHRSRPLVQLVGEDFFKLIEAYPWEQAQLEIGERVYVGPEGERRVKIRKVDAEIEYSDLTSLAQETLPDVVRRIVELHERYFVEFFNIAEAITLRLHSLELLPGVGKKTLMKILEEREIRPFESYEDIHARTRLEPVKALTERILEELKGGQKYYLFIKPSRREMEQQRPVYLGYLERIYAKLGRPSLTVQEEGEGGGGEEAQQGSEA